MIQAAKDVVPGGLMLLAPILGPLLWFHFRETR